MADKGSPAAPAVEAKPAASPKKAAAKPRKPRPKSNHPKTSAMVYNAVKFLKERNGELSRIT